MRLIKIYILLFFYSTPAFSQEPRFIWGDRINRNAGKLENMEIIGVDTDGFFATYEVDNQVTLEHYDPQHKRFWTTALLPQTPKGDAAIFHSVQMIDSKLYMISSSTGNGKTQVYAQEVNHSGNYSTNIQTLAQGVSGETILIKISKNDAFIAILTANEQKQTLSLLSDKLAVRWTKTFTSKGVAEELLVLPDGIVYLLAKAPAAAPATTAYSLYQFSGKTGKSNELVLGHTDYRPISAKLAATLDGNVVIAGFMSPSSSVSSQHPEPVGTFLYQLEKQNLQSSLAAYTPFSKKFISDYKRLKPDYDNSQRLRYLHLDKVIPLNNGSFYLLGEVCTKENRAGTFVYHNNDIIIARLRKDGSVAFTTSINKLQSGTNKQNTIRSYFATIIGGTLRLLYLDFEHNYKTEDKIAMYSPRSTLKTPVMVTVLADGTQKYRPLQHTQSGREAGFYIRPRSAYKVSEEECIIIGIGPEFYRYGRMKF